jgi:hypothetical protein
MASWFPLVDALRTCLLAPTSEVREIWTCARRYSTRLTKSAVCLDVRHESEDLPRTNALQLVRAAVLELNPGAGDQILDRT